MGAGDGRRGELSRSPLAGETEQDRWQRNFADLLQELRVAQTGVQILFAFLLTLPFSARFADTTGLQRSAYLVALVGAAGATAMIISPVAMHRALFRQGRKPELVRMAHRMATGGLAFMIVSMVSSVFLITDFVLSIGPALAITTAVGLLLLTFWVLLPLLRRLGDDDDPPPDTSTRDSA